MPDGRVRERNIELSEKMFVGEDPVRNFHERTKRLLQQPQPGSLALRAAAPLRLAKHHLLR